MDAELLVPSFLVKGCDLQTYECKVEYAISGLLPANGVTLFYGASGVGKTIISLAMANAVATGAPFMDLPTKQMPVVYIDFENPLPVLVRKVQQIDIQDVYFWHMSNEMRKPPRLDTPEWVEYKTMPAGALIIFDTLRAAQNLKVDDSEAMALIMSRLKELRELGFTILFIHHTTKASDKMFTGSVTIISSVDQAICLNKTGKLVENAEELEEDEAEDEYNKKWLYRFGTMDKTRYMPFQMFVRFDGEIGFARVTSPDDIALLSIRNILLETGVLHQQRLFELVRDRVGIRKKGKVVELLDRGTGIFWNADHQGRGKATMYTPILVEVGEPVPYIEAYEEV